MKEYIKILSHLLLVLTGLFMLLSSFYFAQEYNFNETLKVGVLTGFLLAVVVAPFIAFVIFLMHKAKISEPQTQKEHSAKEKKTTTTKKKKITKKKKSPKPSSEQDEFILSGKEKLILLMDENLTLNVTLSSISEQNIGTVTQKQDGENLIVSISTDTEHITLFITPLTKHSTELTVASSYNSEDVKKIIRYIKEKEFSFLNY